MCIKQGISLELLVGCRLLQAQFVRTTEIGMRVNLTLLSYLRCPLILTAGSWSQPTVEGVPLPPITYFSLTKVDDRFSILCGGSTGSKRRNSDINTYWMQRRG